MAQNDQKWPQNRVWTPLGPLGPTNFDFLRGYRARSTGRGIERAPQEGVSSTLPILPQLQGFRTHLEPLSHTQMNKKGQKRPKRAKKWLKMAKNGPTIGPRRHLGPGDPLILTTHSILPQPSGVDPLGAVAPYPNGQKGVKRGPKMAQNGQGPKIGSRRHLGPRDPPILTPRPILPQL